MLSLPSASEVAEGIRAFDVNYGEMERALWRLSRAARTDLLRSLPSPVVEGLVWTIRSCWGVQGVRSETKTQMARALAAESWTEDQFEDLEDLSPETERSASDIVARLVSATIARGAKRQEFSLASKVLHWLMPWRIPVYDSFVRNSAGVPPGWGHLDAYRRIVQWEFDAARRLMTEGSAWLGDVEPRSPFRALDKYMWWIGGGSEGRALVVRNPWQIVRRLGLSTNSQPEASR
jgi:hypothetical protein